MLHYAVVFFVIAVIAALLGFSGIAGAATNIAWILFVVFLILGAVSLLRGRKVQRSAPQGGSSPPGRVQPARGRTGMPGTGGARASPVLFCVADFADGRMRWRPGIGGAR